MDENVDLPVNLKNILEQAISKIDITSDSSKKLKEELSSLSARYRLKQGSFNNFKTEIESYLEELQRFKSSLENILNNNEKSLEDIKLKLDSIINTCINEINTSEEILATINYKLSSQSIIENLKYLNENKKLIEDVLKDKDSLPKNSIGPLENALKIFKKASKGLDRIVKNLDEINTFILEPATKKVINSTNEISNEVSSVSSTIKQNFKESNNVAYAFGILGFISLVIEIFLSIPSVNNYFFSEQTTKDRNNSNNLIIEKGTLVATNENQKQDGNNYVGDIINSIMGNNPLLNDKLFILKNEFSKEISSQDTNIIFNKYEKKLKQLNSNGSRPTKEEEAKISLFALNLLLYKNNILPDEDFDTNILAQINSLKTSFKEFQKVQNELNWLKAEILLYRKKDNKEAAAVYKAVLNLNKNNIEVLDFFSNKKEVNLKEIVQERLKYIQGDYIPKYTKSILLLHSNHKNVKDSIARPARQKLIEKGYKPDNIAPENMPIQYSSDKIHIYYNTKQDNIIAKKIIKDIYSNNDEKLIFADPKQFNNPGNSAIEKFIKNNDYDIIIRLPIIPKIEPLTPSISEQKYLKSKKIMFVSKKNNNIEIAKKVKSKLSKYNFPSDPSGAVEVENQIAIYYEEGNKIAKSIGEKLKRAIQTEIPSTININVASAKQSTQFTWIEKRLKDDDDYGIIVLLPDTLKEYL